MAPLLVTALVGIGVKIAGDLFSAGAKALFSPHGPETTFATSLADARATVRGARTTVTASPIAALDTLAERSHRLAVEANTTLPGTARAQGVDAYRRLSTDVR